MSILTQPDNESAITAREIPPKDTSNTSWIGSWLVLNEWRLFRSSPTHDEKIVPPDPTPSVQKSFDSDIINDAKSLNKNGNTIALKNLF